MTEPIPKLKVMHLILTLERAGAQEVIRTLCEQRIGQDCETMVCTFEDGGIRSDLEALGIKVEVLGLRKHGIEALPWFLAEMLHIRRRLVALVEEYKIDIVQTHLLQTLDFLVLTLRSSTRVKAVLWTIENVDFLPEGKRWWSYLKRSVHRLLYRLTIPKVDGVIAVSEKVRDAIVDSIGSVQDRITVIPNAVDTRRFRGLDDKFLLSKELGLDKSSLLIAVVGRLSEQKGHCFLVEAAPSIIASHRDAHFLIIGDGELRDALKQQVSKTGVSDNFHFLGVRNDIPRLLASVDLFVLPSLWEGLSIALLEAMAAARPIVCTAVSGTEQVMIPGKTGLVVPPGDSRSLAEAIDRMLSDPERARSMGNAARRQVDEKFGAQKQSEEYLSFYREVLNRKGDDAR